MYFATISTPKHQAIPALFRDGLYYPLPYPDMRAVIEATPLRLPPFSEKMGGEKEGGGVRAASPLPELGEGPGVRAERLLPPLRPTTLRDAYAFEQHVRTASQNRGRDVPKEWYEFPVFYYTNPHSIFGPEDVIPYPAYTSALDYELEIAVVIGKAGMNIRAEEAEEYIFGYTIFNDWSARDVQRAEMKVGLGPAKGKDFASSLGPFIVTREALADRAAGRAGVYDLEMRARVNGVEMSKGNLKDIYWSFGEIIARASQSTMLLPGDAIGSGTVGTGCLLELTKGEGPWLKPGDVVELEVERIGVLRNTIGRKA